MPTQCSVTTLVTEGMTPIALLETHLGGHLFQIPTGDLMRKTLFEKLQAKGGRLTVLISDTCNARTTANIRLPEAYSKPVANNPLLLSLLLRYKGLVDISGSSKDQYGWFSYDGGWFTISLQQLLNNPSRFPDAAKITWKAFFGVLSDETSKLYLDRKKKIIDKPGMMDADTLKML